MSSTLKPSTISTFWRFSSLALVDTEFSIVQCDSGKYAFPKACTKSPGAGCDVCGHVGIRVLTGNVTEQSSLAHIACPLVQLSVHRTEPAEGMVQRLRCQYRKLQLPLCFCLFWDRTLLCSRLWSRTQYVAHAGNLTLNPLASASQGLELQFSLIFHWVFFVDDGVLICLGLISSMISSSRLQTSERQVCVTTPGSLYFLLFI